MKLFTLALRRPARRGALPLRRCMAAAVVSAVCAAALVSACSSRPPTPDWQMNAHSAAQKALDAYLSGNTRVAQLEWARARDEVSRTGRPDLLARLELLRCAAQVASLELGPCERFELLRSDAAAPEQAYAAYLVGHATPAQVALLPDPQRAAAAGDGASLSGAADPLTRLVAAAVLLQTGRATPAVIEAATETASAQGWRRPLMAWLSLQAQRAEAQGDAHTAATLRRRVEIVEKGAMTENRPTPAHRQ